MGRGGARPNSGPEGAYPNLGKTKAIKLPESRHEQFRAIAKHFDAGGEIEMTNTPTARAVVHAPGADLQRAQVAIARAMLAKALDADKSRMKREVRELIEGAAQRLAEALGEAPSDPESMTVAEFTEIMRRNGGQV